MIKKAKFLASLPVFVLMFTVVVPYPTFAENVSTQHQEEDCECNSSKDVGGKKNYSNSDVDMDVYRKLLSLI